MIIKSCSKCKENKPLLAFCKNESKKDGLATECRSCKKLQDKHYYINNLEKVKQSVTKYRIANPQKVKQSKKVATLKKKDKYQEMKNAVLAKYRASKLQATPLWFEKDQIKIIYQKAKQWGFEVDHIVPLKGATVCGLHCWANLQLLDPMLNVTKGNRYWPDMP